jgi:hypothetical protein
MASDAGSSVGRTAPTKRVCISARPPRPSWSSDVRENRATVASPPRFK